MNANELADELEHYLKGEEYDRLVWEIPDLLRQQQAKLEKLQALLREYTALNMRQQAEIEALRMGFAGNGTSDSELAEVRAMANRQFLEIEALKAENKQLTEWLTKVGFVK